MTEKFTSTIGKGVFRGYTCTIEEQVFVSTDSLSIVYVAHFPKKLHYTSTVISEQTFCNGSSLGDIVFLSSYQMPQEVVECLTISKTPNTESAILQAINYLAQTL